MNVLWYVLIAVVISTLVFLMKDRNDNGAILEVDAPEEKSSQLIDDDEDALLAPTEWVSTPEYKELIQFWLWQLLLPLGGKRRFVGVDGFDSDKISKVLDILDWQYEGEFSPNMARKFLQETYNDWKKNHNPQDVVAYCPPLLGKNIEKWAILLNLSEDECAVLKFTLLMNIDKTLDEGCDLLGELNYNQVVQTMSVLLRMTESRVRAALSSNGALFNTGLVKVDLRDNYYLGAKLDVLSSRFVELMTTEDATPIEMLKEHVLNAPESSLTLEHFEHLGELLPALKHYLESVLTKHSEGCNILLYGMAGTGKTEFSRVIAKALEVDLFEVSWVDHDGDPTDRGDRLSALRAAQHIFAKQKAILLFDEIEDVFAEEQKDFAINKAWINRMMESNQVPTIWVTNHVDILDPAMIRRFDFVVEMLPPTRVQRERMLQEYTKDFLSKEDIRQLSEHQTLVPALLERSHKVTCTVQESFPEKKDQAQLFQKLLGNTLKAQGYADITHLRRGIPNIYDINWVNCKQDLSKIAQGLGETKSATLCLYGPSGTGKSAYVKWMSEQINTELIYKRASDLLSKYVGESEQLIAAAFDEARSNHAILLFDEVDSFLQDRRGAAHSWEVSMVNEMLTQMEHFEGIFIATTNLMKNLDQAALRRFDFKIELSYLKPEQAWRLFERYCQHFDLPPDLNFKTRLANLHVLTPGDFSVAAKRARITPFKTVEEFFGILQEECALKENGSRGEFGFI